VSAVCAVCSREEADWELFARDIPQTAPLFHVLRCHYCGFGWTEPFIEGEELAGWYPPAYYGKGNVRFNALFEWLVRLFRWRRASVIRRRQTPGPVIDIGCGRGLILSQLKENGWDPHGVEVSEHAAWHAKDRGAKIHVGDFLDADYPDDHFHAVIFWHSLEHLPRPVEALRKAHRILKKGGLIVVAVPNSDSLQAQLTGKDWFHLDIPRHLHHFGLQSLRRVLDLAGFRVVQEDHFSFEQNPYGWLQSIYNALGFRFNFLYSILKNRTSRSVPIRTHPIQTAALLALMPVLLPLSILLTVFEAAIGRGGTIEVYAKKR